MALINRLSRLFKADFHAVLDQIEEPEQVLRQSIRDMEDELRDAERRIELCVQECARLSKRRSDFEAAIRESDEQLDLCFNSGKEELAKGLVRKKLEVERMLKHLDSRLDANTDFLSVQRRILDDNKATLDGLRQKSELFSARSTRGEADAMSDDPPWNSRSVSVTEDEVEIAFLREQSARSPS